MGGGLEGNFWEEGLPLCVQSRFECLHGCSGHNTLWQLVPVWGYYVGDDESYTAVGITFRDDLLATSYYSAVFLNYTYNWQKH